MSLSICVIIMFVSSCIIFYHVGLQVFLLCSHVYGLDRFLYIISAKSNQLIIFAWFFTTWHTSFLDDGWMLFKAKTCVYRAATKNPYIPQLFVHWKSLPQRLVPCSHPIFWWVLAIVRVLCSNEKNEKTLQIPKVVRFPKHRHQDISSSEPLNFDRRYDRIFFEGVFFPMFLISDESSGEAIDLFVESSVGWISEGEWVQALGDDCLEWRHEDPCLVDVITQDHTASKSSNTIRCGMRVDNFLHCCLSQSDTLQKQNQANKKVLARLLSFRDPEGVHRAKPCPW